MLKRLLIAFLIISSVILPTISVYAAQGNTFEKNAVDEIKPNQLVVETILY
ncbi:MAG: hypothetical protein C0P72_000930 [Clostridia bacterium]